MKINLMQEKISTKYSLDNHWTQEAKKYCECGCGKGVKNRFVHGHNTKGTSAWNKGLTKETSEGVLKISNSNKGKILTEEHRKKMSESRKGRKQVGKRYSEEAKIKMKIYRSGGKNGMFGRHHSEKTKEKIIQGIKNYYLENKDSEKEKIRRQKIGIFNKDKKLSDNHKNKISVSHLGKKHSESSRKKMRQNRLKQILPIKDSSIEIKIQNYLKNLNIDFFTHQYIDIEHGYQCDIFIPILKLVIECDGNYWHKYPTRREIDNIRTSELLEKGFKVLRLWESEIQVITIEQFKEKLFNTK